MKSITAFLIACLILTVAQGKTSAPTATSASKGPWYIPHVPSFLRTVRLPFISRSPAVLTPISTAKVSAVKDLNVARTAPKPPQVLETGNVVINVYGQPGAVMSSGISGMSHVVSSGVSGMSHVVSSGMSGMSDAVASIGDRIKVAAQNMPTMRPFKMPKMPKMPTIPSHIKVPVAVQVHSGQEIKFPAPPVMPTLPPLPQIPSIMLPEKITVHRAEIPTPTLPAFTMPATGLKPVKVEYQDFKPAGGSLFAPGTYLVRPVTLKTVPAADKKHKKNE